MSQQNSPNTNDLGFFKPSKFHLGSTVFIIALSVFAFLPMSFNTMISGTTLVNFVLVAIMVLSLIILLVDLVVNKNDDGGVNNA
ncbi:hypothetical protein [Corynebacterium sp. HMSC05E07]|uniref:hypothetical protein n=1 Tax=Corynebacterium sp. HMSC05E07 TaxID=1581117 RepID=UPI0008A586E9|nr:hypothetical protein [Corynebacterium sp. HMSC05E07]OFT63025.1 hypothetical protein HMPREF3149_02325 [Corynebacterium sp. HMSC05E07]